MAQQLGSLEKVLRLGEGRRLKRLAEQAAYIGTLEPEYEQLSDAELAGKTASFRERIENGEPDDYLAKRDPEWTKPVWEALGMRASFIQNMMPFAERREAYAADVVYGTNSEFGFDYLRDNMAVSLDGVVQRGHEYAIVDEVDSILIDEARTPLIISGEPEVAATTYYDFARAVRTLEGAQTKGTKAEDEELAKRVDFLFDEKHKTVAPTETGIEKIERAIKVDNLYDPRNVQLVNHLIQALKAEALYKRDVDYVVQDGEVKIVDEFTGRIMEGRRWSEGLHQAIEAKEGVKIQ